MLRECKVYRMRVRERSKIYCVEDSNNKTGRRLNGKKNRRIRKRKIIEEGWLVENTEYIKVVKNAERWK